MKKIWWQYSVPSLSVLCIWLGIMLAVTSAVAIILILVVMGLIQWKIFRRYFGAVSGAEDWLKKRAANNSRALRDEMDKIVDDFTIAANALMTNDGLEPREKN